MKTRLVQDQLFNTPLLDMLSCAQDSAHDHSGVRGLEGMGGFFSLDVVAECRMIPPYRRGLTPSARFALSPGHSLSTTSGRSSNVPVSKRVANSGVTFVAALERA